MMKRIFLISVLSVLLASVTLAQGLEPPSIYIGTGMTIPASPDVFVDMYNPGGHVTGAIGIPIASFFQMLAKAEYHSFPLDKGLSSEGIEYSGGDLHVTMVGIDGRLSPDESISHIKSHALVGFGIAYMGISDMIINEERIRITETGTEFYFEFGGGIDIELASAAALFVQLRYVTIMTEGEATGIVPLTVGVKFW